MTSERHDANGWTRIEPRRGNWWHRVVLAVAGCAIVAAPLVPARFSYTSGPRPVRIAHVSDTGAVFFKSAAPSAPLQVQPWEHCERISDLGVPIEHRRPDDPGAWQGIVRAGGPRYKGESGVWLDTTIGLSRNRANCEHVWLILSDLWHKAQRNMTSEIQRARLLRHTPDLSSPHSVYVRQFTWLAERGLAGWRTMEFCLEWGYTPERHLKVYGGDLEGFTRCAVGWTALTVAGGATVVYVDSARPNDSGDGLSDGAAKKTIAAGEALLGDNEPDHLLLKRGSSWNEKIPLFAHTGLDADNPCVVRDYGTGVRPIVNGTAGVGGVDGTGAGYIQLHGIKFTASDYVGLNNGTSITGATFMLGSTGILIENCLFEGLNLGTNLGNSTADTDFTVRRCISDSCFAAEMSGGGFYAGAPDGIVVEENIWHHNGWNETKTVLSVAITGGAGGTVTFTGGSANNDTYIGVAATISGASNGPFIVTDSASGSVVVTPVPDVTSGTLALIGAAKNVFQHNQYIHPGSENITLRRNVSIIGGSHGLGKAYGQVYHNIDEGSSVGLLLSRDVWAGAGACDAYQNHAVGNTIGTARYSASGISQFSCIVVDNVPTGATATLYDNTCGPISITGGGGYNPTCIGFDVAPPPSGTITVGGATAADGNFFNEARDTNQTWSLVVRVRDTNGAATFRNNKIEQPSVDKLVHIRDEYSGTDTWLTNSFASSSGTGLFAWPNGQSGNFAAFAAAVGETGSFTGATHGWTNRTLADWDAELGGAGTQAAAATRLMNFDRGGATDWSRLNQDATWLLNYIRDGYGKALIGYADMPYPIVVANFGATRNGPDVDNTWDALGNPDAADADHISVERGGSEVETAAGNSTGVTVVGGTNGTYRARVVDYNGVQYATSDEVAVGGGVFTPESRLDIGGLHFRIAP